MIIEIDTNLLEYPLDGFLHQANCFHTMGGGIAFFIKKKYPELYEADVQHGPRGDVGRLGQFSFVKCHDDKIGYNLYSQHNFGGMHRNTNYEALYSGLAKIKIHSEENNIHKLGLPRNMGCVLGGGSWRVVKAIIDDVFDNWGDELYICNYNP